MTKTAKIYGDSLYDLAAEEKLTEGSLPSAFPLRQGHRGKADGRDPSADGTGGSSL